MSANPGNDRPANPAHAEDVELLRSVARGDPSRLEELTLRLACVPRFLVKINARRAHPLSANEIDDVAQETLTRIWERLEQFNGSSRLETWIFGFCGFGIREREFARRRNRETAWEHKPMGLEPQEVMADPLEARTSDEFVLHCLERLGPPASIVIHMKLFQESSFDAIARALGQPSGSVKTWYYRGLDRIRDWIDVDSSTAATGESRRSGDGTRGSTRRKG